MGVDFWAIEPAAGYDGPLYSSNPHEVVQLGGEVLPGICTVKALPTQQVDRQQVPGRDGADLIWRGYLPGPIDIECLVWTAEQWERLQEVITLLWIKPGKKPASVDKLKGKTATTAAAKLAERASYPIVHPALQAVGITRVALVGISLPEQGPVPQSRVINFKCIEYVPTDEKKNVTRTTRGTLPPRVQRADELMSKKIQWIDGAGPPPSAFSAAGDPYTPVHPPARREYVY